jgi:hypothetical protein
MPVRVLDRGRYELFETAHHHRILVLNEKRWLAWVKGEQSDILVRSDSRHEKERTIRRGKFYLVDFRDDPKFKDMPHLFLQRGDRFQELLLPNGLPTDRDPQKRVAATRRTITVRGLEEYLRHPAPAGPGEARAQGRGSSGTSGPASTGRRASTR